MSDELSKLVQAAKAKDDATRLTAEAKRAEADAEVERVHATNRAGWPLSVLLTEEEQDLSHQFLDLARQRNFVGARHKTETVNQTSRSKVLGRQRTTPTVVTLYSGYVLGVWQTYDITYTYLGDEIRDTRKIHLWLCTDGMLRTDEPKEPRVNNSCEVPVA